MERPKRSGEWGRELERWVAPFLVHLRRGEQRVWAPIYLRGLLGPGERKSIEPIAERVAPGKSQSLHHFITASPWDLEPFEATLVQKAQSLVGGRDAIHGTRDGTSAVLGGGRTRPEMRCGAAANGRCMSAVVGLEQEWSAERAALEMIRTEPPR